MQNGLHVAAAQAAAEDRGLAALVKHELAGLGAEIHNAALIDDHHALAVGDGDDGAVGDNVVILAAAAAEAALRLFESAGGKHVLRQRVRVKILLPLAGKRAANRVQSGANQSHTVFLSFSVCSLRSL